MPAAKRSALVPAVTRAFAVLDLLAQERTAMSLARLADSLELPKSSVHGLCNTLLALGYLRRQSDGAFFIGPSVMTLAEAFVAGTNIAQEFATLWSETHEPQETVILSVLSGTEVVYVAARNGLRPLGLAFNVGMRLPAHLAASGKAMLAFQPVERVRELFGRKPLPGLSRRPAPTLDELLTELDQVRAQGFSIDDEGVREGVHCIGAPVFDASGQAVAGVGMCIQKARLDESWRETHRELVMQVARQLTERLGGVPFDDAASDSTGSNP
ncbi:MAG: IclR family transcriptional regulator [Burkholderiaceae bacterium]|nr:IclR family transcriptional regulator [Burkholderiaceae bacterium]